MSVAAFFKDKRVQAAMSGPRSDQASLLTQEFFSRYGYADCSVSQLLALSDLAARCSDVSVAQTALQLVIESGSNLQQAFYKIGRLKLTQARPDEAAAQFALGIAADANFPHNYMGAARALYAQGRKEEAAASAERFASFAVRPHGNEEFTVLGDLADFLFDSGRRDRALPIYALIKSFGAERTRHVVRLAEARIAAADFAGARRLLEEQVARTGADPWTDRALALCDSNDGTHDAAIAHALSAVRAQPTNQGFIGTYIRVLGKSGDAAAIEAALSEQAGVLTAADIAELTARLQLVRGDLAAAATGLLAAPIVFDSRLYYLSVETAYLALAAGMTELADTLSRHLAFVAHGDTTAKILRIDVCFRQLQWEDAGVILATLPPDNDERPQLAMKRLEYACFTGDKEAAANAARRLEDMAREAAVNGPRPHGPPARNFMLPVFRYLAEQQDWDGIVERALTWISAELDYGQIGYVLFRAAKHSGRQQDMLAAIHAVDGWASAPGLLSLRNNLAQDLARTMPDIDALLQDPAIPQGSTIREKLAVRRDVLAAAAMPHRQAVFLCTDSNYLCATIVALHGLSKAVERKRTDFFIVADDDVAGLARDATAAFIDAGFNLTIVPASEVVGSASRLFPSYGLFTSGHKLASAAYYRIYFARYLQLRGAHGRALYVDSDIILTGRLDPLLRLDLGGHPMAARLETPRPEVRRATDHHGLADGRYFNSGVLLFDLLNPTLPDALDAAVAAIADDNVTLLYHDQCALNLGFRTGFCALDMAWNMPVTETTALSSVAQGTALLHFLDRPKPWSAAYNGEAGPLWFEKWREAAAFIGEDMAVRLFSEIRD